MYYVAMIMTFSTIFVLCDMRYERISKDMKEFIDGPDN